MERVIEQLRRGGPEGVARQVQLADVASAACARQSKFAPAPACRVTGHEELYIRADRDQLVTVLAHVIRNAQEATDPRNGHVSVMLSAQDCFGVICVSDDGVGMDESFVRERLFRPFDSTKGTKGMGIGAFQVKQFVEAAGGTVRVTSERGRGTRFELCLPLVAANGATETINE
jgi:signal transduction histidine kinase